MHTQIEKQSIKQEIKEIIVRNRVKEVIKFLEKSKDLSDFIRFNNFKSVLSRG